MHGYWMDKRLFNKLNQSTKVFIFEEYLREKAQKELDEKRGMRVPVKKFELPGAGVKGVVNKKLMDKLITKVAKSRKSKSSTLKTSEEDAAAAESILQDPRFTSMFNNPDFEISEVKNGEVEDANRYVESRSIAMEGRVGYSVAADKNKVTGKMKRTMDKTPVPRKVGAGKKKKKSIFASVI
jgi:hypothetical protein